MFKAKKWKIGNKPARCFNIVDDPNHKLFGVKCNSLLAEPVDGKPISAIVVCTKRHCRTKYIIDDGVMRPISRYDREKGEYVPVEFEGEK